MDCSYKWTALTNGLFLQIYDNAKCYNHDFAIFSTDLRLDKHEIIKSDRIAELAETSPKPYKTKQNAARAAKTCTKYE